MQEYSVVVSLSTGDKIEFHTEGNSPEEVKDSLMNNVNGPWKFAKKREEHIWFDSTYIVSISIEKVLF